jgi:hypothetical protein
MICELEKKLADIIKRNEEKEEIQEYIHFEGKMALEHNKAELMIKINELRNE